MIERWKNLKCFLRVRHTTGISEWIPIHLWRGKAALSPSPASLRHRPFQGRVPKTTLPLLELPGAWSSVASLGGLRLSASQ